MDYVILIPNNGISTIEGTVGGSNGYYYTKVRTRSSICVVVLSVSIRLFVVMFCKKLAMACRQRIVVCVGALAELLYSVVCFWQGTIG